MIYAVADIHGHLDQLDRALGLIHADGGPDAPIVFLGDYVDRGPNSAGVLQRLMDGVAEGRPWVCLRGNHDKMLLDFLTDGTVLCDAIKSGNSWLHERLGGLATLASFTQGDDRIALHRLGDGLDTLAARDMTPDIQIKIDALRQEALKHVPAAQIEFLAGLKTWHSHDDLIFVHGGIRPGLPMGFQQEEDLIWIREPFLSDRRDHGALIVHGHTMLKRPQHYGNRVNLDGGAGAGRLLIPAVFEGRVCHILTDRGRWPLGPQI